MAGKSEFTGLHLDRSLLQNLIADFMRAGGYDYELKTSKENELVVNFGKEGEKEAIVNFYFLANGKTSIRASGGPNPELGCNLAKAIKDSIPPSDWKTVNIVGTSVNSLKPQSIRK